MEWVLQSRKKRIEVKVITQLTILSKKSYDLSLKRITGKRQTSLNLGLTFIALVRGIKKEFTCSNSYSFSANFHRS